MNPDVTSSSQGLYTLHPQGWLPEARWEAILGLPASRQPLPFPGDAIHQGYNPRGIPSTNTGQRRGQPEMLGVRQAPPRIPRWHLHCVDTVFFSEFLLQGMSPAN